MSSGRLLNLSRNPRSFREHVAVNAPTVRPYGLPTPRAEPQESEGRA